MHTLAQKVAVIAGANGRIGTAVAHALANEGCHLVLLARHEERLRQTAADLTATTSSQVLICPTDVASYEAVQQARGRIQEVFPHVDLLYNGIAGRLEDSIVDANPAEIAAFIQTTLTGTIWLTQALLPLMPASARIVNILTDWAMPNMAGPSTFVAGKYGLLGFGQALAAEVGIRVTNLLPGDVASDPRAKEQSAGIPLEEMVRVILLCFALEGANIDQMILTP